MMTYLECWIRTATALFEQALLGEPKLEESLPKPLTGESFGFAATITGDQEGRFAVVLDSVVLEAPLFGEGADQKAGWGELLREVAESAVGELLAKSGQKCKIETFEEISAESKISTSFQLSDAEHSWTILVRDDVRVPKVAAKQEPAAKPAAPPPPAPEPRMSGPVHGAINDTSLANRPGVDLLLDIELEATLRFGSRELPLGEILELGPGDVVQLDRHISDPVDLVVGDKIVARGEVVLVNGNFGMRVTEVAAPRKRLESIRCLF